MQLAVLKHSGFVALTGGPGTGKTTLLASLIRSAESAHFAVVFNPTLDSDEFLELVLVDFGITDVPSSKAQRITRLQKLLVDLHEQGKVPVLIEDEAHKLSPEVLEEIRLLNNFESTKRKLLQIVLAGQSELAVLLNRDDLRQVKQRIEIRLQVRPLARRRDRKLHATSLAVRGWFGGLAFFGRGDFTCCRRLSGDSSSGQFHL